jgi:hypothetical protein
MGRSAHDKRTAFSILKAAGYVATPSPTNDPVTRRDALRAFLLRTNGFLINPSCTRLVEALSGAFGYKRLPDGTFSDQALKNNVSHVAESAEYGAIHARLPHANHTRKREKSVVGAVKEFFYG